MSGYIGNIPVPQATQTRDTFTATASQTTFATSGYTPSFLDVFLNGVHLVNGTDYTATNGSDVVLTSGAAAGDTLEVVAYSTYQVNSQNYTGGLTVDNDGATVLTVDRATSDGTIIDLQKDGTSVGSVGNVGNNVYYSGGSPLNFSTGLLMKGASASNTRLIVPSDDSGTELDDKVSLGRNVSRFKDLYLSGGVYLGGTGAANYLDDYEEGTFTPTLIGTGGAFSSVTYVNQSARYIKIGNTVTVTGRVGISAISGGSGTLAIGNLPFTITTSTSASAAALGYISGLNYDSATYDQVNLYSPASLAGNYIRFTLSGDNVTAIEAPTSVVTSSFDCSFSFTYATDA